jgi:hypothetical protein
LVLAGNVLVTTAVTSLTSFGARVGWLQHAGFEVGVEVLVVLVNVTVYWLAFRVLIPASIGTRELFPGAVLGGVGWNNQQSDESTTGFVDVMTVAIA